MEETRVCEWCAKSIPKQAIKCSFCHKWRNDITRARQRVIVGLVVGVVLILSATCLILHNRNEVGSMSNQSNMDPLSNAEEFWNLAHPKPSGGMVLGVILLNLGFAGVVATVILLVITRRRQRDLEQKNGSSSAASDPLVHPKN
jgi:hypothetical protein